MVDVEPTAVWQQRFSTIEELASEWKSKGLGVFQKGNGESDALRIAANAELVAAGRRDVSTKTRDFAKLDPEAKLQDLGALVKSYQGYVDEITRALNHASSAHKTLYAFLKELTDPYPALERFARHKTAFLSVVKHAESASELKSHLNEREAELLELRNQDITIRHLREQIASLELGMAAHNENAVTEASVEVNSLLQQWNQRESAVQQELTTLSQECRRLQLTNADLQAEVDSLTSLLESAKLQADASADDAAQEIEDLRVKVALLTRDRDNAVEQLHTRSTPSRQPPSAMKDETTPAGQRILTATEAQNAGDRERALQKMIQDLQTQLKAESDARALQQEQVAQLTRGLEEAHRRYDGVLSETARVKADAQKASAVLEADLLGSRSEIAALRQRLQNSERSEAELRTLVLDLQRESNAVARSDAKTAAKAQDQFNLETVIVQVDPPAAKYPVAAQQSTNSDETVSALLAQRESLRKRIMTLEELSTAEVKNLKIQLDAAKLENRELLASLRKDAEPEVADSARHPPSLFGLARQSAVDRAASIVSHLVLSSRESRRAFAAYQLVLHVLMVVFVIYYIV